jgi:hypothetical protein
VVPNAVVKWLTFLLCIEEVPASTLGPETGYPDRIFRGFPQFLQTNSRVVPYLTGKTIYKDMTLHNNTEFYRVVERLFKHNLKILHHPLI